MRLVVKNSEIVNILICAGCALYVMLDMLGPLGLVKQVTIAKQAALAFISLPVLFSFILQLPKLDRAFSLVIAFFALSYINLLALYDWQAEVYDATGLGAGERALSVLNYSLFCFISGISFPRAILSRFSRSIMTITALSVIFMFASVSGLKPISWGDLSISELNRSSHLSVADGLVFLLFAVNSLMNRWPRWTLSFAILYCIFISGGRGTFIIATLCIIGASVWPIIRGNASAFSFLIIVSIFLSPAIFIIADFALMYFFPGGLNHDSSAAARSEMLWRGLGDLDKQLFGGPQYIYMNFGGHGAYMHNILSAWQLYGLGPFLIVVYLIIASVRDASRYAQSAPVERFAFLFALYVILCAFTAKYVGTYSIWFSLGIWVGTRRQNAITTKLPLRAQRISMTPFRAVQRAQTL